MRISDWSSDVCSSDLVTGTDTGAGKTTASVALLHALRARGLHAVGMKPLASGCERDGEGRWRNDDALALQAASDPRPAYDDVNPFALPLPIAPEFDARDAGIEVTPPPHLAAPAHPDRQIVAVGKRA